MMATLSLFYPVWDSLKFEITDEYVNAVHAELHILHIILQLYIYGSQSKPLHITMLIPDNAI